MSICRWVRNLFRKKVRYNYITDPVLKRLFESKDELEDSINEVTDKYQYTLPIENAAQVYLLLVGEKMVEIDELKSRIEGLRRTSPEAS